MGSLLLVFDALEIGLLLTVLWAIDSKLLHHLVELISRHLFGLKVNLTLLGGVEGEVVSRMGLLIQHLFVEFEHIN